ncbi:MAG: methyltransferase [Chloroflexi bacterium RBG_13_68_17]|nr:MAG: methyltransferase [Chloroflexi bacterium RBG_13_68_17]
MSDLKQLFQAVLDGDADVARETVEALIAAGTKPEAILGQALIPAMDEVGARFERQEFYVPEMLVSARAMQSGLAILRPLLAASGIKASAKAAIGTVQGDLHDIGKNLVIMMLEGAGLEVIDLGVDVPPQRFAEAVRNGAQLVGISALLTTTMAKIPDVIEALEDSGVRPSVKVIVGGAPLNQAFADKIGADGYAPDASQAASLAKRLLSLK